MGSISLLYKDPVTFLILAVLLLYSVILHETAHGWVALLFGDDTAKRAGRLTLSPGPHLSPVGALALFLVGFGWAKPVPVDYRRLNENRFAFFCVALAGCATNIIIAIAALFFLHFEQIRSIPLFAKTLPLLALINIMLGALNLIPIPPLDGAKVLTSFLPQRIQLRLARVEPYGFFILILLIITRTLDPVIIFMQKAVVGFIALFF